MSHDYTREYEDFVESRCRPFVDFNYTIVAINEEAGEIAGWYKKAILRGDENYSDTGLKQEMGDVLFYLTKMAHLKGWTLKDVMGENIMKLTARGPLVG